MPRLFRTTRSGLVLAAASLIGLAASCKGNNSPAPVFGPSGSGGTLTASISANPSSGRAPLDVTFTSDVKGGTGAYFYQWAFGAAGTSTAPNPRVQFRSGGTYDVTLQVTAGDQTAAASPLSLHFDSDVILSCSIDPPEAIAPADIAFRADAQGGNASFAYRWDFGDGTSSTAASPNHTYATPGSYQQVLTVTSGGASAICSHVVTIYGTFRMNSCKANPVGGTTVQFHATPSFCLFNQCGYDWNFGGGGSGSGVPTARPLFTYSGPGTYTASLNASTNGGRLGAACSVTVTVP